MELDASELASRLANARVYLGYDKLQARRRELEASLARPDAWENPATARQESAELGRLMDDIGQLDGLQGRLQEIEELLELASGESDESLEREIRLLVDRLTAELDALDLRSLLGGEHDECDAICEVHAGAGGTDAQDWAEMMLRMYLRWAERRGFAVEIDEVTPGQEAGILSATVVVRGRHAYGLLTAERGVHRLVRMSPFNAKHTRETSFASLDVTPIVEGAVEGVKIEDKDLRIDTYRSSGAGGQHVNVTDSAVRITHLPTGTVVSCQNERSQHQNKAKALEILGAKLAERQRQERQAALDALGGPQTDNAWGSQIRSYVLAPYQLVKDLRTQVETGNVQAVLDGDLDPFMEAYLRWRRSGRLQD